MPTISWFYGIAIRMYIKDHSPPRFHAIYGGDEAYVSIETGEVIERKNDPLPSASSESGPGLGNRFYLKTGDAPRQANSWRGFQG